MNMGANIGGAVSPTITPWIADQWGWPVSLATAAFIAFLGGILWLNIDPGKGLHETGVSA
jgi:ACS family glucarate transporter-like MFS transporter